MKNEIVFKALGTDISVQVVPEKNDPELEKELREVYHSKEKIFSRFLENSELARLNNNIGKFNPASSDIIEVAKRSLFYHSETDGYFDPRIIEVLENIGYDTDFKNIHPGKSATIQSLQNRLDEDLKIDGDRISFRQRMDFSGIAKGYITDKAAEFLKSKGYENFLVDSGGDIRVSGRDEENERWRISLEGFPEEKILIRLDDGHPGIATSGITRRKWHNEERSYHHIINPKNPGHFSFDLKSVTVVAKNCEEADVWAKVLFLMGKDEGKKFSNENKIKSIFLDYRGDVYISESMRNMINRHPERQSLN